jgi:dTDP-4-amino-4,6-dideoxygalactose transaminase
MLTSLSLEDRQRQFYEIDDDTVARIVRNVLQEELSVVDGGVLERFEQAAADFFGARHAVAVCNGTAAIHLALFAMDLKPGDEVLMPTYAYYALALPVCLLGAVPVFCDIREDDLTLDIEDAEAMRTSRTRAVIVHQPHGCPADAERLRAFAHKYDLTLICDATHAHGALWDRRPLGNFYDYVCASLGKGKLVSGGELGVVTASTDRCRDRMLLYGHVNRVPAALLTSEYRHIANAVGIKYRPHPFALAIALEQLNTYAERSRRLVRNVQIFEEGLLNLPDFSTFAPPRKATRVYWRFPVRVQGQPGDVKSVARQLQERECPVSPNPGRLIHRHNVITEYYGIRTGRAFPVAERIAGETLSVDAFPMYEDGIAERLVEAFREVSSL